MEYIPMIYRFKVIQTELYDKMIEFASYHRFEKGDKLKQNFQLWLQKEDIASLISRENVLLRENQYDFQKNTIETKIFKSIKYYHIKNMNHKPNWKNSNPQNTRGISKVKFSKEMIEKTRAFLQDIEKTKKPSACLVSFQETHQEYILQEMKNLNLEKYEGLFYDKFKKMFKNQYFIITK